MEQHQQNLGTAITGGDVSNQSKSSQDILEQIQDIAEEKKDIENNKKGSLPNIYYSFRSALNQ